MECNSAAESKKLKELAEKELGNNYNIRIPTARTPFLRNIVITSFHDDETLVKMIRDHNESVFNVNETDTDFREVTLMVLRLLWMRNLLINV